MSRIVRAGYVVTVDFEFDPVHRDRFLGLMRENAARSVADEKGCRHFDVCLPRDGSPHVFLYEIYDAEAAFKAHLETPHFKAFAAATKDLIKSRKITVLDLLDRP